MDSLNQIVNKYLETNGIKMKFFANYIGCEETKCLRWLKGERKLSQQQLKRTHEFLDGQFLKSAEEIMKEG